MSGTMIRYDLKLPRVGVCVRECERERERERKRERVIVGSFKKGKAHVCL